MSRCPRLTFCKEERAQVQIQAVLFGRKEEFALALHTAVSVGVLVSLEEAERYDAAILPFELFKP
jgi:hypothetical protein